MGVIDVHKVSGNQAQVVFECDNKTWGVVMVKRNAAGLFSVRPYRPHFTPDQRASRELKKKLPINISDIDQLIKRLTGDT